MIRTLLTILLASTGMFSSMSDLIAQDATAPHWTFALDSDSARQTALIRTSIKRDQALDSWIKTHPVHHLRIDNFVGQIITSDSALEVLWIQKDLAKGRTEVKAQLAPGPAKAPSFAFADTDNGRELSLGDQKIYLHVTRYDPEHHDASYKTFHHVYGRHDDGLLTKGAGGKFTHHRGLFLGFSQARAKSGRYDFWHCKNGATVRHRRYLDEAVGPIAAQATAAIEWLSKDQLVIVHETRRVLAWNASDDRTVLDFEIRLRADDPVHLGGDPQHAGFQFRANNEVSEHEKDTRYLRPKSAQGGKNDVWEDCNWVVCDFTVREHRHAVLHMTHPQNPKGFVYSTRAYGRFGSFAPTALAPGKDLVLRYRVIIFADPEQASTAGSLYEQFTTPVAVTITR